mmetsp:Transcript_4237/g.10104  ORF Transcript_4237/g.10104 Transcript_4237/m.10104 type:complete len:293 (-) Transcript_4237:109-987(-)
MAQGGRTTAVLRRISSNSVPSLPQGLAQLVSASASHHASSDPSGPNGHAYASSGDAVRQAQGKSSSILATYHEPYDDLCCDLRSLNEDLRDMEAFHRTAHRLMTSPMASGAEHSSTSAPQEAYQALASEASPPPALPSHPSSAASSTAGCSATQGLLRSPVPDGPVFSTFQREICALRGDSPGEAGGAASASHRGASGDTTPSGRLSPTEGSLASHLEEVRSSNRMVHRALASVQKRLKNVEHERDCLRAERDHLRSIVMSMFPLHSALQAPAGVLRSSISLNQQQHSQQHQ